MRSTQSPSLSVYWEPEQLLQECGRIRETVYVVRDDRRRYGICYEPRALTPDNSIIASLPPLYPEWLGDPSFRKTHGVRFCYATGEMAGGIAGSELVVAAGRLGMIGFLGAGGLAPAQIDEAIGEIRQHLEPHGYAWGTNLIHNPHHPRAEAEVTDLYIRRGVSRVSASAFMAINENLVRLACHGLTQSANGQIRRRHYLFAKISRPELAKQVMSPAPNAILDELVKRGQLTALEASLARQIPLAEDITVEADSGGHTDNRPLSVIFPVVASVRDEVLARYGDAVTIRIGAAGGIGTPSAVAAAFSLGAAYVMTGSINQTAREAQVSQEAKQLLQEAQLADVAMAPSADMFELGVRVQVLKRGTWFAQRAELLYQTYVSYDGLSDLPPVLRRKLENEVFGQSLDAVWAETRRYFAEQDPDQLARADSDPKFQMALVFRWYLGHASRWAIEGRPQRRLDYQLWCGPAMGAFNNWARGTFLEALEARTVEQIALNLMEGAAVLTRVQQLRLAGVAVPAGFNFSPRPLKLRWSAQ
ncbi:MAG: 2-nitropropane dioxygenase [Sulfobacillus acidophilus]|uniref:2-nitropropane dioxygenase n=1 Tax=Sulfobacillus acidophilus TaxID=53633 RepID=A0A2T2WG17_9FIRM|nr:MAG: 2-nitropropane dioxygenase [Sulfobacillus acidophilus]